MSNVSEFNAAVAAADVLFDAESYAAARKKYRQALGLLARLPDGRNGQGHELQWRNSRQSLRDAIQACDDELRRATNAASTTGGFHVNNVKISQAND